ncbi:hypothetical protein [Shimazuella soli]|nr:hypothetical protein [Shimazuella soli]
MKEVGIQHINNQHNMKEISEPVNHQLGLIFTGKHIKGIIQDK